MGATTGPATTAATHVGPQVRRGPEGEDKFAPRTRRGRSRGLRGAAVAACFAALGMMSQATPALAQSRPPIDPQWLTNALGRAAKPGEVQNNTVPGAIERRDQAISDWNAALAKHKAVKTRSARAKTRSGRAAARLRAAAGAPDPLAKPEYVVVWAPKASIADANVEKVQELLNGPGQIDPQGLIDTFGSKYLPNSDGYMVIDARRHNIDGSVNSDYGRVVNFVQLPLPWGLGAAAHHMMYNWKDGEPIVSAALVTSTTFVMGVDDVPNMKMLNAIGPAETGWTIPDAVDRMGDGRFVTSYMGGPLANFGGSPGAMAVFKPDAEKGLVLESVTPTSQPGAALIGNPGGVPEACSVAEARPMGTCGNPHGVQSRLDLKRMVTFDFAEPREIILDPVKTIDTATFRPTTRTWDISDPGRPRLVATSHMPAGWRTPTNQMATNRGIAEGSKTFPPGTAPNMLPSKGVFAGATCGGGMFFNPDVTRDKGDASANWTQVWDDGISQMLAGLKPDGSGETTAPSPCPGGGWIQVTPNNRWLFRAIQGDLLGTLPTSTPRGKLIAGIDIEPLLESYNEDGKIQCDLTKGIDTNGDGKVEISAVEAVHRLAQGEVVADCPRGLDQLVVNDTTRGGPHWGAFDDHSLTADGFPTRLVYTNDFYPRVGEDGDKRLDLVNIGRDGKLSRDRGFRDEQTGQVGLSFARRDWPGSPDAGEYRPHSMVFVCPPGICKSDTNAFDPAGAKARITRDKATRSKRSKGAKRSSRRTATSKHAR